MTTRQLLTAGLATALAPFLLTAEAAEDSTPLPPPTATTDAESPAAYRPSAEALERRDRRERAAAQLEDGDILLVLSRGGSSGFTGKKRSDEFHYVSPIAATDAAVLVFKENGQVRHHIYLQKRLPRVERWNGPTVGPGEATAERFAFDAALPYGALAPDLGRIMGNGCVVHMSTTAPADGSDRRDTLMAAIQPLLYEGVTIRAWFTLPPGSRRRANGKDPLARSDAYCSVRSAAPLLTDLRAVKSEREIEYVRRAVEATVDGLLDTGRTLRPGLGEYQIQGLIEFRCKLAGCATQAFDSIVGSGPNSCILHYKTNRRIMQDGDIVVVDVGGEYEGYAADVTRTFPVNGTFTARQAEVYDAVLAAQEAGIAAVKPGATHGDVHKAARAVLQERGLAQWFIHGTCHSVGLNVHDAWGRSRKLEVGSILTVEPGVYIPGEELGVRIEDTILVTADGPVILSAGAPKKRTEVEALMAEPAPIEVAAPAADGE